MDVRKDFLPRLVVQKSKDETLSYSGKQDFLPEETEIRTIGPRNLAPRPRTQKNINSSYT